MTRSIPSSTAPARRPRRPRVVDAHALAAAVLAGGLAAGAQGADEPAGADTAAPPSAPQEQQPGGAWPFGADTLTGDWFGHGEDLERAGISLSLDFWAIYQKNTSGGVAPEGGSIGQYRLTTEFDLGRIARIDGGTIFMRVDGGWIDPIDEGVGDPLMPVNYEFFEDSPAVATQLWYQQDLLDRRLSFRAGRLDIAWGFDFHEQTVAFDCNQYANYGTEQFLNSGLINNASIPFPDYGLGAAMIAEPVDRFYVAAGMSNANAVGTSPGFSGTFDWLVLAETGVAPVLRSPWGPLPGMYCAGYWHSGFEDAPSGWGVYFDMNQLLLGEGGDDGQGLGMFARYGYANGSPLGIEHFWSIGGQYRGLLPGRDADVIAVGWAQSFTDGAPDFTRPYEAVLETYYRAQVTPWFQLSPMLQLIVNPGSTDTSDALVFSLRGQFTF